MGVERQTDRQTDRRTKGSKFKNQFVNYLSKLTTSYHVYSSKIRLRLHDRRRSGFVHIHGNQILLTNDENIYCKSYFEMIKLS